MLLWLLSSLIVKKPLYFRLDIWFLFLIDTSLFPVTSFGFLKFRRFDSLEIWIRRPWQPWLPLLIIFQIHGLKSRECVSLYH
jgi:hypothetical protein